MSLFGCSASRFLASVSPLVNIYTNLSLNPSHCQRELWYQFLNLFLWGGPISATKLWCQYFVDPPGHPNMSKNDQEGLSPNWLFFPQAGNCFSHFFRYKIYPPHPFFAPLLLLLPLGQNIDILVGKFFALTEICWGFWSIETLLRKIGTLYRKLAHCKEKL